MLSRNISGVTLSSFVVLTIGASYYRFVHLHDYMVAYEVECDPIVSSCYIGCEDDDCKKEYYYAEIKRKVSSLMNICGPDIAECEEAYSCETEDSECQVLYCDPELEPDSCAYEDGSEARGQRVEPRAPYFNYDQEVQEESG